LTFLATDDPALLAVVVAAGALTDLADGFLARVSGTESRIGVLLDPFCDKFFVLMGLISFLPGSGLQWSGFLILVLRDVFTVSSYATGLVVGKVVPFRSRLGGKITTALQVVTLFALIFAQRLVPLLVILVAVASLYAIIDYGNEAVRSLQRREGTAAT
jgi:CDP-diacylglycerol--glycerol-3-phosphate 3-phosphatidyltransferase